MTPYIHFIVNPTSGGGRHQLSETYLKRFFPKSDFRIAVDYTQHKGHAIALTREIIAARHGTHKRIQNLQLEQPETVFMDAQIDGEFHNLKTNVIHIGIIPKGLRVVTA